MIKLLKFNSLLFSHGNSNLLIILFLSGLFQTFCLKFNDRMWYDSWNFCFYFHPKHCKVDECQNKIRSKALLRHSMRKGTAKDKYFAWILFKAATLKVESETTIKWYHNANTWLCGYRIFSIFKEKNWQHNLTADQKKLCVCVASKYDAYHSEDPKTIS